MKFMNETFKAALQPSWTVTETCLIYKKLRISYDDIISLQEFSKATKLTNGVWHLGVQGKIYNLIFSFKDNDRAIKSIDFIKEKSGIKQSELKKLSALQNNSLLSAKGMYQFAVENGFGNGFSKGTGEKHFAVLEKNLMTDENPIMTFIGLHNYISSTKHSGNYAFALTNKRIILGQSKMVGENFQSINIGNINDITYSGGMLFGILTVDTLREKFNIALDKNSAQNINLRLHEELEKINSVSQKQVNNHETMNPTVNTDELRNLKQLLDDGIITQEDFDQKKKQILGL